METGIAPRLLLLSVIAVSVVEATAVCLVSMTGVPYLTAIGLARLFDGILIIVLLQVLGHGLSDIGLSPSSLMAGVKRGLAWSGFFFGLALMGMGILLALGREPPPIIGMTLPPTRGGLLLAFVVAGFIGPVAEEMFFRGIIFGYFRAWGFATALAASSLLFAAAHLLTVPLPLVQLFGGVLLAVIYEYERNLMVPIVVHVAGNIVIIMISL